MENKKANEFDWLKFLSDRCSLKPCTIMDLLSSPLFVNAMKSYKGEVNDASIMSILEKLYNEMHTNRTDTLYKERFIAEKGVNAWLDFKKEYKFIANGYRKIKYSMSNYNRAIFIQNSGMGFLYKKISLPYVDMSNLLDIEEFILIIRTAINGNVTINDRWVYEHIEFLAFPMMNKHSNNLEFKQQFISKYGAEEYKNWWHKLKTYQRVLAKLSKQIFDNNDQWLTDYQERFNSTYVNPELKKREIVTLPDNCQDISYILDICVDLKKGTLRKLFASNKIVDAIKKSEGVNTLDDVYNVFKSVFYPMVRKGYKNHEDADKRKEYYTMREIAADFSEKLTGDKFAWHNDYNNYFN